LDVNDCDPEFQWPSRGNETLIISSRTPRGYLIARLRATDRDSGINANLTYYLVLSDGSAVSGSGSGVGGNAVGAATLRQSPFIVVPDTGAIVVAADLSKLPITFNISAVDYEDIDFNFSRTQQDPVKKEQAAGV
jgi:hypothetical protein